MNSDSTAKTTFIGAKPTPFPSQTELKNEFGKGEKN